MISEFFQKLMFTHQLDLGGGTISFFGKEKVVIPASCIVDLLDENPKKSFEIIRDCVIRELEDCCRRLSASKETLVTNLDDVFSMYGLGRLEIIDLNLREKKALVRVHDSPLRPHCPKKECVIMPAVLVGIFSYLFSKNVTHERTKCPVNGKEYCEFILR